MPRPDCRRHAMRQDLPDAGRTIALCLDIQGRQMSPSPNRMKSETLQNLIDHFNALPPPHPNVDIDEHEHSLDHSYQSTLFGELVVDAVDFSRRVPIHNDDLMFDIEYVMDENTYFSMLRTEGQKTISQTELGGYQVEMRKIQDVESIVLSDENGNVLKLFCMDGTLPIFT